MSELLRVVDLRSGVPTSAQVNRLVPRASLSIENALEQIKPLLEAVKVQGESALVEATLRFDKFDPSISAGT